MSSDKIIQQQSELSDTNDKLIPEQQKRDVRSEKRRAERKAHKKEDMPASVTVQDEADENGNGLVDLSERSKRARSSG